MLRGNTAGVNHHHELPVCAATTGERTVHFGKCAGCSERAVTALPECAMDSTVHATCSEVAAAQSSERIACSVVAAAGSKVAAGGSEVAAAGSAEHAVCSAERTVRSGEHAACIVERTVRSDANVRVRGFLAEVARLQDSSMREWYLDCLWGSKEVRPMSSILTIELPEDLSVALQRSPRELANDVRLAAAIDWYHRGLISQGRAAEVAGIPRADFIDALAFRKIEVVQVDLDALDRELGLG